jgi:hypothetical protein
LIYHVRIWGFATVKSFGRNVPIRQADPHVSEIVQYNCLLHF